MGYNANTIECDFTVPADRVQQALDALRADEAIGCTGNYESLADAVEDLTCFMDCSEGEDGSFSLGYHSDKYLSCTDAVLDVLGRFASEGSYVRFMGEDDCLFGFRVADGVLRTESGDFVWTVDEPADTGVQSGDDRWGEDVASDGRPIITVQPTGERL